MNTVEQPPAAPPAEETQDAKVIRVEIAISTLLRIGVVASLILVFIGMFLMFQHHRDYLSDPPALEKLTEPGAAFPHSLKDVANGLRDWRGQSIVALGLLLLIATPVMRVAVSILAFAYQRDRIFVVLTSLVLSLLIFSFLMGRAGG